MVQINATHENGSRIAVVRSRKEVARTIDLMRQSGYVSFYEAYPTRRPDGRIVYVTVPE